MFKRNQIYTAMLAVTLASVSGASLANETTTANAGVSVSNAFSLTETTPLDLGTFLVTYKKAGAAGTNDFTQAAAITLKGDGTYGTETASAGTAGDEADFVLIAPGTPGEFNISGAAPNSPMTVDFPTTTNLVKLGDTTVFFTLVTTDDGSDDDVFVVDGPAAGQSFSGTNLITDATGQVSFAYGGTLSLPTALQDTAGTKFSDGTYTGTFDVTVTY